MLTSPTVGRLSRAMAALLCAAACSCGAEAPAIDEAKAHGLTPQDFPADAHDYFGAMDANVPPGGAPGAIAPLPLSPAELKGRNTWMLWCGGNEGFWDWLANNSYGFMDLLKLVDFRPANRWPRFAQAGLVPEPGTKVPDQPDEYGLWIRTPVDPTAPRPDEKIYGRSSGIVGLRLFKNPKFDERAKARWDPKRYNEDPRYYSDPSLVRPYRVGMSCALCHAQPHPLNPPADVEAPGWENLSATAGNQYLRTRSIFGNLLPPDSFVYHLLDSQPRGTIDTSLIASDNINNPNTMNAIWEVPGRLDRSGVFIHRSPEYARAYTAQYGTGAVEHAARPAAAMPVLLYSAPDALANPRPVPRILLDGADSIGAWGALARVYLNIGTFYEEWIRLHNPLLGFRPQQPFRTEAAKKNSVYWLVTDYLVDDLAKYFLKSTAPMRLRDAPSGKALVKGSGLPWAPELAAGRRVFAERCIVCHSSKQPKTFDEWPAHDLPALLENPAYRTWATAAVEQRDFWEGNYLSTDRRIPVTVVGTNAGRAMATNGLAGQMWEDFTSDTYKQLPAVGQVRIWNPFTGREDEWTAPGGGRGYYRPASLVGVWATAPLLHNNSVGIFNGDPSVDGRVAAFRDAIGKLLAPGKAEEEVLSSRWGLGSDLNGATPERLGKDHGLIWRIPQASWVTVPARSLPHLVEATTGGRFGVLLRHPWIVPAVLFAIAAALLVWGGRRFFVRVLGYLAVALAVLLGIATAFLAGHLGDLRLGPIPAGTPVSLLANVDPARQGELPAALYRAFRLMRSIRHLPPDSEEARDKTDDLGDLLLRLSKCPDLVMDRGHTFAVGLTDRERQDLVDLLMTF
jgi:cytochrome c5